MALLTSALVGLLVLLLVGSWAYCVLTVVAARRYLAISPPALKTMPPISVLKPLCGQDDCLEENLRSFFTQDYPEYEILFAVHSLSDPAVAVVEKVRHEFPRGPRIHLVETGESAAPNAKAHSLGHLVARAQHSILVMSDSDVQAPAALLRRIAAEFQNPVVGVVTCPYRAVPGKGVWSRLEALGMNTQFLAGVLVAWLVGEMDFALGPTLAARREVIEAIGGFDQLGDYLAEDFVIGNLAPRFGYRVVLSSCVIEHRIGSQRFKLNFQHRLRWARSTRRSRPAGYWGEIFTNPIPLAVLLWLAQPKLWPVVAVTALFRTLAAWSTAEWVLHDPLTRRRWWLIPIQDVISLLVWIAGFFGSTIDWRGRRYKLLPDGRFQFIGTEPAMAGTNRTVVSAAPFSPHDLTSSATDNEIPGR
ncbi:MAG TPA: bacteriohopanetetrol glucosamine biosynthesis glycosyltransferase HpnI [Terriglobales bacterium]|nr:bacteriohopanetetrol glucosamine biosynthesis glycosyltransferase HpnI [Terriglobales bacterium]